MSDEASGQQQEVPEESSRILSLEDLPIELLILIFDYCHAFDLVRISQVCRKFNWVAKDEILWKRRNNRCLVTNQASKRFRDRCRILLSSITKWRVTHNWEFGRYQTSVLFSQKAKLMPWIQLTGDILWWSGGNQICGYLRSDSQQSGSRVYQKAVPDHGDFCKFVVKNDQIISGHRDGSLKFWALESNYDGTHDCYSIDRAHSRDIDAVDRMHDLAFSGSSDEMVKVWIAPQADRRMSHFPVASMRMLDRIWSLSVDPTSSKLAVGTAGNGGIPLFICDVNNFVQSDIINHNFKRGAGILDMVWEDPHTLLTCGYDTCVRKWDMRTGTCVSNWSDPTDATIYCLSSDYQYTIVTGTQFNCKSVLWDQRKAQYIQLYFMNLRRLSSPVYSVSFDSCHLYGATDQTVVEVKFSGEPEVKKNYREIMNYRIFATDRN